MTLILVAGAGAVVPDIVVAGAVVATAVVEATVTAGATVVAVVVAVVLAVGAVLGLSPQAASPIANNRPTTNQVRPVLNLVEFLLNVTVSLRLVQISNSLTFENLATCYKHINLPGEIPALQELSIDSNYHIEL